MDADERPDEDVRDTADPADETATEDEPAAADAVPEASVPQASVPLDRYTAGGVDLAAAEAAASGRKRRALLLVGLSVLLIVLCVGGWFWWDANQRAARGQAIRDTATAYLAALADADADAALATLAQRPDNTTLLTDEVLVASRATAAISDVAVTDVTVSPEDERRASAAVTYRIGTQPVETTLALTGDGRTSWRIADGLGDLTIDSVAALTVNGATLTETTNPIFPGIYTAAATNPHLTLNGTTTTLLTAPDAQAQPLTVTHALSESGTQAVLGAVKGRFDECLASTSTLPENCPFGVDPGGVAIVDNQVEYELKNDPWAGFSPTLDVATLTASGVIHFEIDGSAVVSFEGRTGRVRANVDNDRTYTVDLTRDPLTVVWS